MLPEQNDTDLSDDDMIRRINEELGGHLGQPRQSGPLVERSDFERQGAQPGELKATDQALVALVDQMLEAVAGHIEAVELRALRAAMDAASEVNAYLNSEEPWHVVKEDPERAGTILWTAIQAISGIRWP